MSSGFSNRIKAEAHRLGFFACGVARAQAVDDCYARRFMQRMAAHGFADMHYMYEHTAKRLDPRLLVPGTRSIVSLALNYAPDKTLPDGELQIARYALGKDYHDVMKRLMHQLAANLGLSEYRCFVDTAPVLEQYWAQRAGLGWIGRNQQLIIPKAGSMFFLGELFLPMALDYDEPMGSRCGTCHRCVDACPTHALYTADGQVTMDAARCLSYQTIENRNDISAEAQAAMGNCFYGCDRCLTACPWNRFATPSSTPELQPNEELLSMTTQDWARLTEEDYRRLFKGSAVKRAKYSGVMRNIHAALSRQGKARIPKNDTPNGQDASTDSRGASADGHGTSADGCGKSKGHQQTDRSND